MSEPIVTTEYFHALPVTDEVAAKLADEAAALDELTRMPAWQVALHEWAIAASAVMGKRRQMTDAELADARRAKEAIYTISALPSTIVAESNAVQMGRRKKEKPEEDPREALLASLFHAPAPTWTQDSARSAIKVGALVAEMVGHRGWPILMTKLAALDWAYDAALADGTALGAQACQSAIKAIPAPMVVLMRLLRAGVDARAFLMKQDEGERTEGVSNA